MELLDKKIKEYIASISVPDEIKPSRIKQFIENSGEITAGKFLKKLREMKISTSTPIAKGLMGHKVGDVVEIKVPAGVMQFEILEISI